MENLEEAVAWCAEHHAEIRFNQASPYAVWLRVNGSERVGIGTGLDLLSAVQSAMDEMDTIPVMLSRKELMYLVNCCPKHNPTSLTVGLDPTGETIRCKMKKALAL